MFTINVLNQEKLDTFILINTKKVILLDIKNYDVIHLVTKKKKRDEYCILIYLYKIQSFYRPI